MGGVVMKWGFLLRVGVKAAALLVVCNLLFMLTSPLPSIGRISWYNWLIPGRERLPYGENPAQSYSLSLNSLDAMFASHAISRPKADDEFRVLLIGDSSTWGFLLEPDDTLAGQLNRANMTTIDGKAVKVYNVGYPTMSLTKDLLLLDYAMRYEPDMVVWLFTLESFPRTEQLDSPLVYNNPDPVRDLMVRYDLNLDLDSRLFVQNATGLDATLIGQRRPLADWLRLQVYGVLWMTTGIDQYYPPSYTLRQSDFDENIRWKSLDPQPLDATLLALDVLVAGIERVGDVPILLVNEPMFISDGTNSDLRYNFFYPRWVYDDYRELIQATAEADGWAYVDLWDVVNPAEFTDSPVHLTPNGTRILSRQLIPYLLVAVG